MLGPVFRHEMFAAGRKRRFHLFRVVIGVILLIILWGCYQSAIFYSHWDTGVYLEGSGLSIAARSQLTASFFLFFAWMTLIGVLGVTPALAAGAIATERERRTIEYLFATDLSNAEIVLDKLAARLLLVVQIVVSTIPLLAIFRLLGGVPGDLLLLHFAALSSTALCVAAISLLVSTWCERAKDAVSKAYGALTFWLAAPAILFGLNIVLFSRYLPFLSQYLVTPAIYALAAINPVYIMMYASGMTSGLLGIDFNHGPVLVMIAGHVAIASCCLGLCIFWVRRVHLQQAGTAAKSGKSHGRKMGVRSPYEDYPMLWKEMFAASAKPRNKRIREKIGGILLGFVLAGLVLWQFFEALTASSSRGYEIFFGWVAFVLGVGGSVGLLMIGSRAAGSVTYEKERETWVTILTTPLEGRDIIWAKIIGNLYVYRWLFLGLLVTLALGAILHPPSIWLILLEAIILTETALTAATIGLLFSLRVKSSVKAIGMTVALLIFMGGGYLPFVGLFAALISPSAKIWAFMMAPCVPFLLVTPISTFMIEGPDLSSDLIKALIIGVTGYGLIATVLIAITVNSFDELSGRFSGTGGSHLKPSSKLTSSSP